MQENRTNLFHGMATEQATPNLSSRVAVPGGSAIRASLLGSDMWSSNLHRRRGVAEDTGGASRYFDWLVIGRIVQGIEVFRRAAQVVMARFVSSGTKRGEEVNVRILVGSNNNFPEAVSPSE